ncbi:MAG: hypothetical protein GC136_04595 [Alphaproteobacteria bacterium]|nr:hypothetical protein [Alphaproteobacteria bacterium]
MGQQKQPENKTAKNLLAHLHAAGHKAILIGEGLIHIGSAPPDLKADFTREAATCVTETVIVIVEDVLAPEVTLCIDAFLTAEKIAATPPDQRSLIKICVDTAEGLASGVIAATHCFANAVNDLEQIGEAWEASHTHQPKEKALEPFPEF